MPDEQSQQKTSFTRWMVTFFGGLLFLVYFVIPGFVMGSYLNLIHYQGKSTPETVNASFLPSTIMGQICPPLGVIYDLELKMVWLPTS